MSNLPKVSVIIPSFNRFDYLLRAIDSVESQNYKNLEIIVVMMVLMKMVITNINLIKM